MLGEPAAATDAPGWKSTTPRRGARSWRAGAGASRLRFAERDRAAVAKALSEASNAEDGPAEHDSDPVMRRKARGAREALANLMSKVARGCPGRGGPGR